MDRNYLTDILSTFLFKDVNTKDDLNKAFDKISGNNITAYGLLRNHVRDSYEEQNFIIVNDLSISIFVLYIWPKIWVDVKKKSNLERAIRLKISS